jgi:hypothetical protein
MAGRRLTRRHANWIASISTKMPPAFMGESEDLKRMKPPMPAIAAAPTMIVIAISTGAKCPLRRLEMPSKYNQMSAIRTSHTRKSGRAAHEAARE